MRTGGISNSSVRLLGQSAFAILLQNREKISALLYPVKMSTVFNASREEASVNRFFLPFYLLHRSSSCSNNNQERFTRKVHRLNTFFVRQNGLITLLGIMMSLLIV